VEFVGGASRHAFDDLLAQPSFGGQ